jgi:hypothetical protein
MIQQLREAAEAGRKRQRHQAAQALLQAGKAAPKPPTVLEKIIYRIQFSSTLRATTVTAFPCGFEQQQPCSQRTAMSQVFSM